MDICHALQETSLDEEERHVQAEGQMLRNIGEGSFHFKNAMMTRSSD
jgi:hypothetical protein